MEYSKYNEFEKTQFDESLVIINIEMMMMNEWDESLEDILQEIKTKVGDLILRRNNYWKEFDNFLRSNYPLIDDTSVLTTKDFEDDFANAIFDLFKKDELIVKDIIRIWKITPKETIKIETE
jgi:hypothetical protein